MTLNEIIQWICVVIILVVALRWVWRRTHAPKGKSSCGCSSELGGKGDCCKDNPGHNSQDRSSYGCDGCPLADKCNK